MFSHPLHQKALKLSTEYKKAESDLISVLQDIDRLKLFRKMEYTSLFEYACKALQLSESVSYALITVARKSVEVPKLKSVVESGELTLSQAKRITSVLTVQNAPELIEKAKTLSQRELEQEVAKINPKAAIPERAKYVTENLIELRMSLRDEVFKKLKRVQDIQSQKKRKSCDLEETLSEILEFYLEKNDPIRKSERVFSKKSALSEANITKTSQDSLSLESEKNLKSPSLRKVEKKRLHLPMQIKHQVQLRDQGQCTFTHQNGERCSSKRWLQLHHVQLVSLGGQHEMKNLVTLCSAHHQVLHAEE